MRFLSIICFTILFYSSNVFAWGDLGHQAVGEIAERNLSPEARAMVREILGIDALANAAIWPDLVRSDPRYREFSSYHFFEIPFGLTSSTLPNEIRAEKSAEVVLDKIPALLGEKNHTRDQKMIWLRYLVHVVGDVHQPLHIGNGVDMGANLCTVKWIGPGSHHATETNLHSVLDDAIMEYVRDEFLRINTPAGTSSKRYFGYKEFTEMLLKSDQMKEVEVAKVQTLDRSAWYDESIVQRERLYPDQEPVKDPTERRYCKIVYAKTGRVIDGAFDAKAVPVLGRNYAERILPILKIQIIKGGLRLARVLNEIAKNYPFEGELKGLEYEIELLKSVQVTK